MNGLDDSSAAKHAIHPSIYIPVPSICCTNEASSWHTGVQYTSIQATATLNLISTRAINDTAGIHHYVTETYKRLLFQKK